MTDRWIDLDGVVNMRDLGGLPTRDGRSVLPRRLIRSDNLQDLSEQDVTRLVDELGVSDIIDLRTETEVHLEGPGPLRQVESLTHHHHSLLDEKAFATIGEAGRAALAAPSSGSRGPRDGEFWAKHYLGYLSKRPEAVAAALHVVASATGAAVVHCAAGKDRTGTVVAMALDVAGVPHEEIVADYVLTAQRLTDILGRLSPRPSYGEALATQAPTEQLPRPESMEAILAAVQDGWGGAGGWLRAQGWSSEQVTGLQRRLTEPDGR